MTLQAITKELSSSLERPFVSLDSYAFLFGKYRSGNFAEWNRTEANRLNLDAAVHNDIQSVKVKLHIHLCQRYMYKGT